jgi:putative transposase
LFISLKVQRLHGQRLQSIRETNDEVIAWLLWSSRPRLHSTLKQVSPMQFEQDRADASAKIAA